MSSFTKRVLLSAIIFLFFFFFFFFFVFFFFFFVFLLFLFFFFLFFLEASSYLYKRVCPSVRHAYFLDAQNRVFSTIDTVRDCARLREKIRSDEGGREGVWRADERQSE